MSSNDLLICLKAFTEEALDGLLLPVKMQKTDTEQPGPRKPSVYLMRLPDSTSATKKAPYVLHQKVTGDDRQQPGQHTESTCTIRSVFCVYDEDEEQGGLSLNECMERLRIAILRERTLEGRYRLRMEPGQNLQTVIYAEDTAPYYVGEMATTWELPAVEKEIRIHEKYQENFI